ncbi:MAG TPA: glycosyltransferase family 1 protein [Rhodobacteraceae bacterium]|nr:glycosyltransferase family 1 protein [Paracoccaceae bacterium]
MQNSMHQIDGKKKYRIGVDVSVLSTQVTGIGRYTFEVIKRLVPMGHEWFLYSHRPLLVGDWNFENVHLRTGNVPKRLLRMLWLQSVMPLQASRDRVDLFWSPAHRLPTLLSARIARVVTIHDLVWKHAGETMRPISRWLDATLMPEAVRLADRIITVSSHTATDLLREMPNAQGKVRSIPLGVSSLALAAPRESLASLGLFEPYFLFVGTLEPRKNLDRLLEAFSRLPDNLRYSTVMAIAGGRGWGGADISTIVKKYGLQDRVRVLGYVSEEQLATLYTHALFLAMPSLYEGFGLPLIEAMSRGIPVLTSNCASMPEVVGDAGILVAPNDVDAIAKGLSELLCNTSQRSVLASRAIANSKRFCWTHAAESTMLTFVDAIAVRQSKLIK